MSKATVIIGAALAAVVVFISIQHRGKFQSINWPWDETIPSEHEAVLRNDLFTLRAEIDQYTLDKQKAPQSLQDLVDAGYMKQIPVDPFTNSRDTWKVTREDVMQSIKRNEPGITDVHSGASGSGSDGRPYSEW